MKEYIDRAEYRKRLSNLESWCQDLRKPGLTQALQMLEEIPAADVAPVVHARWITRSDKGIISMTHPYMCSRCWRVEMNKEPYCNCGAKMDGGVNDASV